MGTKEKLTEIISNVVVNDKGNRIRDVFHPEFVEKIVEDLIKHNTIALPCKVGDTVWCIDGFCDESFEVVERIIVSFTIFENSIHFFATKPTHRAWVRTYGVDDFGKTVFLTHEEAEAALKWR